MGFWSRLFGEDAERKAPQIEAVPRLDVADAKDGEPVKVVGRIRAVGELLTSPLSVRKCAGWEVVVEGSAPKSQGRGGMTWRTIVYDQRVVEFAVEDETGSALVRSDDPTLRLSSDHAERPASYGVASEMLKVLLADHGIAEGRGIGWSRKIRAGEALLSEGKQVAVLGLARWEAHPGEDGGARGYREVPERLVLYPLEGGHLVVSDDPATFQ